MKFLLDVILHHGVGFFLELRLVLLEESCGFVGVEVSERESKYENVLKFTLLKNAVSKLDQFKVGDVVEVSFDVKGREYNGKVYIDLNAWKIELIATASGTDEVNGVTELPPSTTDDVFDGLPF